ncbi:MAG: 4Fe-4S binding protein [Methanosarcinaceae archaeon]|nr:4Fe-4S binding protein [Methanosarcinaceae archaeon]
MAVKVNRYKCGYCGGCVAVCKETAIDLVEAFIEIDDEKCTSCRKCERFCPVGALEVIS